MLGKKLLSITLTPCLVITIKALSCLVSITHRCCSIGRTSTECISQVMSSSAPSTQFNQTTKVLAVNQYLESQFRFPAFATSSSNQLYTNRCPNAPLKKANLNCRTKNTPYHSIASSNPSQLKVSPFSNQSKTKYLLTTKSLRTEFLKTFNRYCNHQLIDYLSSTLMTAAFLTHLRRSKRTF